MNLQTAKWVVIINPYSGKVAAQSEWFHIQNLFKELGVSAVFRFTEHEGHGIAIARELVSDGYRNIAVIGGDGTINEVVNGILQVTEQEDSTIQSSDITMALIPNGTGNDWAREWKIPFKIENAIRLMLNGKSVPVDLGRCTYMVGGRPGERYFINTAGMGFEVRVLQYTNPFKRILRGRSKIYAASVIWNALFTRAHSMTLAFNETTFSKEIFSFSVGNGRFSGGGFSQTPLASPTDGSFDVMIMSRLTFKTILLGLKYLFNGKLLKHPAVRNVRTKRLVVSAAQKSYVEVDGVVIPSSCPVTFTCIPSKIHFVVPNHSDKPKAQ